jgi:diamine N-acetyltransferase
MNTISLKEVTNSNFKAICDLSDTLTDAQKKCVASNQRSLAQAYLDYENAWPRAIYLDDTPIGFLMLHLNPHDLPPEDQPGIYLWRFMIAFDYQNKGYGKQVLDLLVQKCRDEHKKSLYLSCEVDEDMPYQFYIKYGFIDTKVMDDGEEVLKMIL